MESSELMSSRFSMPASKRMMARDCSERYGPIVRRQIRVRRPLLKLDMGGECCTLLVYPRDRLVCTSSKVIRESSNLLSFLFVVLECGSVCL
jgi:hypothetical protein